MPPSNISKWPKNSLLNEDQRRYLGGVSDLDGEIERKFREHLRYRVRRGFADFTVLNQHLREDDIRQLFFGEMFMRDVWEPPADIDDLDEDDLNRREKKADIFEKDSTGDMWGYTGEDDDQTTPVGEIKQMIEFVYRGLRMQGMSPGEIYDMFWSFPIHDAEAKFQGVDRSKIWVHFDNDTFKAEVIEDELTPVEKWDRGMALDSKEVETLKRKGYLEK